MPRLLVRLLLLLQISIMPLAAAHASDATYLFFLNDRPITPTFMLRHGGPLPLAGDLATINGITLPLGTPGEYRFEIAPKEDGKLYLIENGHSKLVGARVWQALGEQGLELVDPLKSLDDTALKNLRGITLEEWTPAAAAALAKLEPATALTLGERTAQGPGRALPALPAGLQFLFLNETPVKGIKDFVALEKVSTLRAFKIFSYSHPTLKLEYLSANKALEYLDLTECTLEHPEALGELAGLQQLNLCACRGLTDIGFATNLKNLRLLDLQCTEVQDLSPLNGLPELSLVLANRAPISKLPEKLPGLKRLDAVGNKLPPGAAAAFARAHPQALVLCDVDKTLAEKLSSADRLVARSADGSAAPSFGASHRTPPKEIRITDAQELTQFKALLKLDVNSSPYPCACSTGPFFEFFAGASDTPLARIAVRHGKTLEWIDEKFGNWRLSAASATDVLNWYKNHTPK